MAAANEEGDPRLLLKVRGDLDHGGGQVLKKDSSGYQILARFARRLRDPDFVLPAVNLPQQPFFDAIERVPPRSLLRRVALSLAARLPSKQEIAKVEKEGLPAFDRILDGMMAEEAFYERCHRVSPEIFATVKALGGSISAEHGVGLLKKDYLHFSRSEAERALMKTVRQAFDPDGVLNPGKLL